MDDIRLAPIASMFVLFTGILADLFEGGTKAVSTGIGIRIEGAALVFAVFLVVYFIPKTE